MDDLSFLPLSSGLDRVHRVAGAEGTALSPTSRRWAQPRVLRGLARNPMTALFGTSGGQDDPVSLLSRLTHVTSGSFASTPDVRDVTLAA